MLLSILDLLKALWESGIQFLYILEKLRSSVTFWDNLSRCIRATLDICSIDTVDAIDEKFSLRCDQSQLLNCRPSLSNQYLLKIFLLKIGLDLLTLNPNIAFSVRPGVQL